MRHQAITIRALAPVTRGGRHVAATLAGSVNELFPRTIDEPAIDADGAPWTPDEPGDYCVRCGASTGPGEATPTGCALCHDKRFAWQRITRLSEYAPPLDERIRAMKFHGQWPWATWLGGELARSLGPPMHPDRVIVCPVPMHWFRRWRRGFNQADLIARAMARTRGYPVRHLLRRIRHTPPQTSVAPSQRAVNVRGSFVARRIDLTDHEVILTDDVKTTGATLAACTRLLRTMGATSVHCVVAAVADPKGRNFTVK